MLIGQGICLFCVRAVIEIALQYDSPDTPVVFFVFSFIILVIVIVI